MQKADSNSSAGAKVDSSTKDENLSVSSHDTKPDVVGSPSLSNKELKDYIFETFTVPIRSINYHLTIA
ncbi:MAG: hypothetical protein R2796_06935 [Chitinophagaceae bacterium]